MQSARFTPARSLLLAANRLNTPMVEMHGQRRLVRCFCAYGTHSAARDAVGLLGFNGEYLEHGDLYILGSYRAYSPALRRFHQPDNLSPFGAGGLNAYAYCVGDPVNHIDPDGHKTLQWVFGISSVSMLGALAGSITSRGVGQEVLITLTMITAFSMFVSGGMMLFKRQSVSGRAGLRRQEPSARSFPSVPDNWDLDPPPGYFTSGPPLPHGSPPPVHKARPMSRSSSTSTLFDLDRTPPASPRDFRGTSLDNLQGSLSRASRESGYITAPSSPAVSIRGQRSLRRRSSASDLGY
ncbi:RHS repeat-associated core domain-containing protein [Pseudomonas japonica]|uniref:RHS repeat-associated core domain-containing protein n=1 Tax=Pseudomonas japonica TaxID=256466 RepID=A0A239GQX9_9PSED|nr:RHS repeat-associated core domain-containing protein [Pseudomonas japonica]SNS71371.1 RHS repeat-associated core domain-containing protein [Pseudomonas japonica]